MVLQITCLNCNYFTQSLFNRETKQFGYACVCAFFAGLSNFRSCSVYKGHTSCLRYFGIYDWYAR